MTSYKDFDLKVRKGYDEKNKAERDGTSLSCITQSITISIEYCDPTNGSCGTGCQNSKRNCPGSTGRRK